MWGKDGAVVRALASNQCGPGSIPGVDAICRLSLLLVLVLSPRVFSEFPVFLPPQKPTHNPRAHLKRPPKESCSGLRESIAHLSICQQITLTLTLQGSTISFLFLLWLPLLTLAKSKILEVSSLLTLRFEQKKPAFVIFCQV